MAALTAPTATLAVAPNKVDAWTQTSPYEEIFISAYQVKSGKFFVANAAVMPVNESVTLCFEKLKEDSVKYDWYLKNLSADFFKQNETASETLFNTNRISTTLRPYIISEEEELLDRMQKKEEQNQVKYVTVNLGFSIPDSVPTPQSTSAFHIAKFCRYIFPNMVVNRSAFHCDLEFEPVSGRAMFLDHVDEATFKKLS